MNGALKGAALGLAAMVAVGLISFALASLGEWLPWAPIAVLAIFVVVLGAIVGWRAER